jgi:hypothetical protein
MRALEIARFLLPLFSVLLTHGQSAENGMVAVGVVTLSASRYLAERFASMVIVFIRS